MPAPYYLSILIFCRNHGITLGNVIYVKIYVLLSLYYLAKGIPIHSGFSILSSTYHTIGIVPDNAHGLDIIGNPGILNAGSLIIQKFAHKAVPSYTIIGVSIVKAIL